MTGRAPALPQFALVRGGIAPALRGGTMSGGGIAPALRGGTMSGGGIAPALRGGTMSGALLVALLVVLCGCESAAAKCARLQNEAAAAWGAYAAVLDAGGAQARRAHDTAQVKAGAREQQLVDAARKQADALYQPRSSAWWRAVDAAQQTLCSKDADCMALKAETAETDQTGKELAARLSAARAAQAAATAAAANAERVPDAQRAAGAVEDDFDRPQLKPARAASAAAHEVCAELAR